MTPRKVVADLLKQWSPERARAVAEAAGTSVPHLRHIAKGRRNASCELALSIAVAAGDLSLHAKICPGCVARTKLRKAD
jgi:hypothetical protein